MGHFNAWVCDHCRKDVHTPKSRADPPTGWRLVVEFSDEDEGGGTEYHYCSSGCESVGPLPYDVAEDIRREREGHPDPARDNVEMNGADE